MSIINDALKKAQTDMGQNNERKKEKKPSEIYKKLQEKSRTHYHPPVKEDLPQDTPAIKTEATGKPAKKSWNATFILLIAVFSIFIGIFIAFLVVLLNQSTSIETSSPAPQELAIKPPAPVATTPPAPVKAPPPPPQAEAPPPATVTGNSLVLSGTMMMGDKRVALINGEIYELGEYVENQKISEITLRNVLLTGIDGKKTILDVRKKR